MYEESEESRMKNNWSKRVIIYMLQRWYYYDHHINELRNIELFDAKSLYFRLTYLTEEQRKILAYLYYYPKPSDSPNNKEIATKFGIKFKNVSKFKNDLVLNLSYPRLEPYQDANDASINERNQRIKRDLQLLIPDDYDQYMY